MANLRGFHREEPSRRLAGHVRKNIHACPAPCRSAAHRDSKPTPFCRCEDFSPRASLVRLPREFPRKERGRFGQTTIRNRDSSCARQARHGEADEKYLEKMQTGLLK